MVRVRDERIAEAPVQRTAQGRRQSTPGSPDTKAGRWGIPAAVVKICSTTGPVAAASRMSGRVDSSSRLILCLWVIGGRLSAQLVPATAARI